MKHRQLNEHRLRTEPSTDIERLMMTHGDIDIADNEHIEVVAAAVATLPEDMQEVLLAVFSEQTPYSQLGERLGCSKTQAWRKAKAALARVEQLIGSNPILLERYFVYSTWEDAAHAIIQSYDRTIGRPASWATIDHCTGRLVLNVRNRADMLDCSAYYNGLGIEAVAELKSRALWQPDAFLALLCKKQHDYGHSNIASFGLVGVAVRIVDKVCRLKNLTVQNVAALNEPLLDTWLDIIGYAVIAEMLLTDTFMLPLEVVA